VKSLNVNPLAIAQKYNIPVPRYTSYPTIPFWKDNIDAKKWLDAFSAQYEHHHADGISLYIHLPFCESLCTFCGCNKFITKNHDAESEYLTAVLKEWELYRSLMKAKPVIKELHLGGGTPTFFSPANLSRLMEGILKNAEISDEREFGLEGHPNNTTKEHLETLYRLGFTRVSFGVQDNDLNVQRLINRIQPFANVERVTQQARETGYTSVNFDLIYGLPQQNESGVRQTFQQVVTLKPERIAFYSYAHVPWASRGQRLFDESDLPAPEQKLNLYRTGKNILLENGYTDIGMDHFALPQDDLYKAWKEGWLHRNFMGYTTQRTSLLVGLGVSGISDTGNAFVQNHKKLHDYYASVNAGTHAVVRGYFLSGEDVDFRKYILDISCRGKTTFRSKHLPLLNQYTFPELKPLGQDGLITWNNEGLSVTDSGRQFVRNVCRAFDLHLLRASLKEPKNMFSKAV